MHLHQIHQLEIWSLELQLNNSHRCAKPRKPHKTLIIKGALRWKRCINLAFSVAPKGSYSLEWSLVMHSWYQPVLCVSVSEWTKKGTLQALPRPSVCLSVCLSAYLCFSLTAAGHFCLQLLSANADGHVQPNWPWNTIPLYQTREH